MFVLRTPRSSLLDHIRYPLSIFPARTAVPLPICICPLHFPLSESVARSSPWLVLLSEDGPLFKPSLPVLSGCSFLINLSSCPMISPPHPASAIAIQPALRRSRSSSFRIYPLPTGLLPATRTPPKPCILSCLLRVLSDLRPKSYIHPSRTCLRKQIPFSTSIDPTTLPPSAATPHPHPRVV